MQNRGRDNLSPRFPEKIDGNLGRNKMPVRRKDGKFDHADQVGVNGNISVRPLLFLPAFSYQGTWPIPTSGQKRM